MSRFARFITLFYSLKNVKSTHVGLLVLVLVKSQAKTCNPPSPAIDVFYGFKLNKW